MDAGVNEPDGGSSVEAQTLRFSPSMMGEMLHGGTSRMTQALQQWAPPSVAEIQQALPQYEITGFIARGGMGAVYKGVQRSLNRAVAIKILPTGMMDEGLDFVRHFKREAQAMATLSHPNIVAVYEAGETADGLLYFTMEYVAGTDVAELLARQGRLPPQDALRITAAVCTALQCAHNRGIIHRDIKPSNVLINEQGEVKVADFGLAKISAADGGNTKSMATVGTPDYLAPESYIQGIVQDGRADIYSTGVMLYKMLTGHVPRGRFDAPSGEVRGLDPRMDRIIDKAMQADPDKRYATAQDMRTEVERLLADTRSRKNRIAAPNGDQTAPPSAMARGRSPLWIALSGIVILIVGGGVWWSQGGAGENIKAASVPAIVHDVPWQNAFDESPLKEVTASVPQTTQGVLLPDNNHWHIPPQALRAGALRVRATSAGGHFVSLALFFDDGKVQRIRYRELTQEWIMSEGMSGEKELDQPLHGGASCIDGKPHDLLLARVGGRLLVRVDGVPLHEEDEASTAPARFSLIIFGGAHISVGKVEYLELDDVPEAKALELLTDGSH